MKIFLTLLLCLISIVVDVRAEDHIFIPEQDSIESLFDSNQIMDDKIYVTPGSVYVAPKGLFVNAQGILILVKSLSVDENGVYFLKQDYSNNEPWYCPRCGFKNEGYRSRCSQCHLRKGASPDDLTTK